MKQILFAALLALTGLTVSAKDNYRLTVNIPDAPDTRVYLVHYYGMPRPKIFMSDSAMLDKRGTAVFTGKDADFAGGIYTVLLKDTAQTNFEILLNKGDDYSVTAMRSKLPGGLKFKGSAENERFMRYLEYMKEFGAGQEELSEALKNATSAADTEAIRVKARAAAKERTNYMRNYASQYPGTLLANVFNAMEVPEVPEGPHYLEDGKTKDSTFAYHYYKAHYWDKFDFRDDRLIFTPLYDAKLQEYIEKLTVAWPDSVKHEADMLLGKVQGTRDLFHYTLWWLTRYTENSKVMGMDEAFVYLVEKYYMKGDAFWLKDDELQKYIDRAQKIAPNVLGNIAPVVKTTNVFTKKPETMNDMKANYTLLVFYSPTCGHCEHEMPVLDSLYDAVLKAKGVKVFTVATEGEEKQITDFLAKHKIDKKWTNTWDPEYKSDARTKYDVYSTPTIYLMDERKIIRGKRLDHSNIAGLIEMLEKKSLTGG
jgi:thiol-disulfide isomerase/thioredoxin